MEIQLGTDGLWARLRGAAEGVVLLLADSVTGLLWPPLVACGEKSAGPWQRLFGRARQAGLNWDRIRGVTSDGAQGLGAFLQRTLAWVQYQRCVWHLRRNLAGDLAPAAVASDLVARVRALVRAELVALIHSPAASSSSHRSWRKPSQMMVRSAMPGSAAMVGTGTPSKASRV